MITVVANNHNSPVHIQDFLEYVYTALRSVGGDPVYGVGDWPVEGPVIVLEGGHSVFNQKMIAAKKAYPKIKIFLVVTEFIKDGHLNSANIDFKQAAEAADHYSNREYWVQRTRELGLLLPHVSGLICLDEILLKQYREVHNNCYYLPVLKVNDLARLKHSHHPALYDFIFSGTVTPYRKNLIEGLSQKGIKVVTLPGATPEYLRNSLYSRARAVLGPRLDTNTTTFSSMRAYYCLINRLPHLFEPVEEHSDLSGFVNFARPGDFLEASMEFCLTTRFRQKYKFSEFEAHSNKKRNRCFSEFRSWLESSDNV